MRSLRSLPLLFLLALCLPSARAQSNQEEYWQPIEPFQISIDATDPQVRTLLSRWNEIGADLKTTANPFAGTYEKPGYRGYFLRWSPEKGFIYVFHSEGLSIIGFSYGKVSVTPTQVVFLPEREMKETFRGHELKTPAVWIPIKMAEGDYMVPDKDVREFGNYVAGFGWFNEFNGPSGFDCPFFFKPDSAPMTSGATPLKVPPPYQHFIKRPITARIVSVGRKRIVKDYGLYGKNYYSLVKRAVLTSVGINAGRVNGVRKDMLFRMIGEPLNQYLKITSVGPKTSRALVIHGSEETDGETAVKEADREPWPTIRAGIKITTSPMIDNW